MKKLRRLALALVLLLVLGGVILALLPAADLRPRELQDGISAERAARGREVLLALFRRQGGDAWRQHRVTELRLVDRWPGALVRAATPWQASNQLRLTHQNGTDDSRLDFLDGPKQGTSWGIQRWATYQVREGRRTFGEDRDLKFWLPTTQFFYDAPFRLVEAEVAASIGEGAVDGAAFERVFLTWGSPEPHPGADHYVAWIGRADGLLHFLEYTVRDAASFMKGCVRYQDHREVEGVTLPFLLTFGVCPGGGAPVHEQRVEEVRFLPALPEEALIPEPGRVGSKY